MKSVLCKQSLVLSSVLALAACINLSTTIPAVDSVPPEVELRINGPLTGPKVLSNPPTEVWVGELGTQYLDLAPDASYHFALFVRDEGGVGRATFSLPAALEVSDLVGDGLVVEVDGVARRLTVRGERSNPMSVLALSGRFRTSGAAGSLFDLGCEGEDFGGSSGPPNQRFLYTSPYVNP